MMKKEILSISVVSSAPSTFSIIVNGTTTSIGSPFMAASTSTTADSDESENSLSVLSPLASNVFPPLLYDAYTPSYFPKPLHYAYLPPILHDTHQWPALWNGPPLWLDDYQPTHPTKEHEFEAVPFRVCLQSNTLPAFRRGQIVSYRERSNAEQRYMIEHCQLMQNETAYLKVVCRDRDQRVFPPYHPEFPAFMLLIPASFCSVDYPQNLREYEDNLNDSLRDRVYSAGCC